MDQADMQDESGKAENDVLELTEELDASGEQEGEGGSDTETSEGDTDEVVISFGDEAAPASDVEAPEWVRDLRKQFREVVKERDELKKQIAPKAPEVGPKPTLEACEYDEERLETELLAWHGRKAEAESAKSEAEKATEAARQAWEADLKVYSDQQRELPVKDFETAEEEVVSALSPAQQAILVQGAENKALLVYALGRSPEKLRQLASIQDPIKFAFAVAKLEGKAKMERRPATSPEGKVKGSAPISAPGKLDDRLSADEWMKRRNAQLSTRRR